MDNRVYVVKCPDYSQVEEKTRLLLNMMGGAGRFFKSGEDLAIKPNLLQASAPGKAVTTHPSVIKAAAALCRAAGANPLIVESPGAGYAYSEKMLRRTYRVTGTGEAAAAAGVPVNMDTSHTVLPCADGRLIRRFEVVSPVAKADALISLCKLKTHAFTAMTGAVKNLFGVIPGRSKIGFHANLQNPDRFAGMLLDLAACIQPRLTLMDAVVGMEGDGPAGGRPRQIGLLMASVNPIALDATAAEVMGLALQDNPVMREAERRGLSPVRVEDVELIGIQADDLRIPGFRLPSTLAGRAGLDRLPRLVRRPLIRLLREGASRAPRIDPRRCTACGACRDACPMQVISIKNGATAEIDPLGCIRCYCCHEMCPNEAVELRAGRFFRFFNR